MEYLFYIEGLGREAWAKGKNEQAAAKALLASLTPAERACVEDLELLDADE